MATVYREKGDANIPDIARRWIERTQTPLVLLDGGGRLLWMNGQARNLTQQRGIHFGSNGLPRAGDGASRALLDFWEQVRAMVVAADGWADGVAVVRSTDHLVVHLYRLDEGDQRFFAGEVETPSSTAAHIDGRLAEYGLTATEQQTVEMLVKGYSAAEIAAAKGNTILTVRTHIKRAYAKMGVNSREKLFSLLFNG